MQSYYAVLRVDNILMFPCTIDNICVVITVYFNEENVVGTDTR